VDLAAKTKPGRNEAGLMTYNKNLKHWQNSELTNHTGVTKEVSSWDECKSKVDG